MDKHLKVYLWLLKHRLFLRHKIDHVVKQVYLDGTYHKTYWCECHEYGTV